MMEAVMEKKEVTGCKEYKLSDADRQKIVSQSPLAKQTAEIEQQRQAFIAQNGFDR